MNINSLAGLTRSDTIMAPLLIGEEGIYLSDEISSVVSTIEAIDPYKSENFFRRLHQPLSNPWIDTKYKF